MKKKGLNIILFSFLLLLVLIIGICIYSNNTVESYKLCKNQKNILGLKDSLKVIKLDNYNQLRDELLTDISIKLNKETCCKKNEFLLELENGNKVNLFLSNNCEKCEPFFHHHWFFNKILINRDNQILIKERLCDLDSVSDRISQILKEEEDSFNEDIGIIWDLTADRNMIEKVINETQSGYLLYYSSLSKEKFNLEICDLNDAQLREIKQKNKSEFHIAFGYRFHELLP